MATGRPAPARLQLASCGGGYRPLDDSAFATWAHIDAPAAPLYSFGYGRAYTTFELSDLDLQPSSVAAGASVELSVSITNTGDRAGAEVVHSTGGTRSRR
jgi:beta-glucosidase